MFFLFCVNTIHQRWCQTANVFKGGGDIDENNGNTALIVWYLREENCSDVNEQITIINAIYIVE
jgi:hypothetical protein